ncbi:MAG: DUF1049 domain-containing protein [Acidimicrobiia bacterium]|nr:DUF1049 domain-containing protein [Acidimicrobiia bacterium]
MAISHDDNRLETDDRARWADGEVPAEGHARTEPSHSRTEPERVVVRKNSAGHSLRIMLATIVIVAIVAFAALNTDSVTMDVAVDKFTAPLAAVIGIAAAAGFIVGWLLGWRGRKAHAHA